MKSFRTTILTPVNKKEWNKENPIFKQEEKIINGKIVWIDYDEWGNKTGNKIYYLNENKVLEWVFSCSRITIIY